MRIKKIAKITSLSLLALVAIAVVGFATFVWNPFEGRFEELRRAVPYNVDFFVAKAQLSDDFFDFPEPAFWSSFEAAPAYTKIRRGELYRSLERDVRGLIKQIEDVESQLDQVPVLDVGILEDAIGEEVSIAGRLRSDRSGFDVCAYTRVSWKLRAGFQLLGFSFVQSQLQGVSVREEEGVFELRGQGAAPVYLARVKDMLVAGTDQGLVKESVELATGDGDADSIWTSADYNDLLLDPLESSQETENVLEWMGDLTAMRDWSPDFANWPGTGPDVTQEEKLLRVFVAPKSLRRVWSSVQFEEDQLTLMSQLRINPGELDGFQRRFQEGRAGSVKGWLKPFLSRVPSTAAFAASLRVQPGDFMRACFQTLEPDAQSLIEDGLRRAGQSRGLDGLIDSIAVGLEPWVGIVFRNNNYPLYKKEFEVAIKSPAPAWALVLRAGAGMGQKVENLITLFRKELRHHLKFDDNGTIIKVGPSQEQRIQEWGNRMIPATGQIALLYDEKTRDFFVSNSGKLVREMVNAQYMSERVRPLSVVNDVQRVLLQIPQNVTGFVWLNGERALNVVQRYQAFTAKRLEAEAPDQGFLIETRPGVEKRVLSQNFPGRTRASQLRGADQKRFEELVKAELGRLWAGERKRLGRDLDRSFKEAAAWLETVDHASLMLRARSKILDLQARVKLAW